MFLSGTGMQYLCLNDLQSKLLYELPPLKHVLPLRWRVAVKRVCDSQTKVLQIITSLRLWSEISLFHKLIYDIAPGSILIGWNVAFRLWRHRYCPDVVAFFAVKSVKKTPVFLTFLRVKHVIKRICNKFSFHTVFMTLVVCFISLRQRLGI